ncbi:MAG: hypothetical protein ACT4QB_00685 [Gammaproteobacteria bacterium]
MDKTKFFTEQVPSGSRGKVSDEDIQSGITDFGAEEIPDDRRFSWRRKGAGLSAGPKVGGARPIRLLP